MAKLNATSLATKYRPQTFSDVVEQNVIKAILQNQISKNEIKNSYLFCGPAGCGKAQPMYSKILTPDGFIEMRDVKSGTIVFTRNGNKTVVSNVYPQGERDIYEIKFNDNTSIRVADNHLNSVYIYDDNTCVRKDLVIETPKLIDLVNSRKNGNDVFVDNPIIEFDTYNENDICAEGYSIGYTAGIENKNEIPIKYLYNNVKVRIDVLHGLIDACSIVSDLGELFLQFENKELSDSVAFLIRSLGCVDDIHLFDKHDLTIDGVDYETIKNEHITFIHYIQLKEEVYDAIDIDGFLSNLRICNAGVDRYITDIKHIGREECQCIYVEDDDHTYISDGFIPTHNTTNARLFAKEINGDDAFITELDAASHNGVDDVRKLIEESKFKPIGSKYRTFIIDECHSLSNSAWQALLKTFEEPTPTSLFVLCTTDPQKIPTTILSRVQRYDFQKISTAGIIARLKYIIEQENNENHNYNYSYEDEAIAYIAKLANGGMRDSITLMEKALSYDDNLSLESVTKALGTTDYNVMFDLTDSLVNMNKKSVIEIIETVNGNGIDLKQFIKLYSNFILDLCKYDILRSYDYLQIPSTYSKRIRNYNEEAFAFFTQLLNETITLNSNIKYETTPKPLIESTFILLCSEG